MKEKKTSKKVNKTKSANATFESKDDDTNQGEKSVELEENAIVEKSPTKIRRHRSLEAKKRRRERAKASIKMKKKQEKDLKD